MINGLQLIRNIGKFDSVNTAANIRLGRLTLVYAENGRGKTTLAAILRSLATGNPLPISERRRLAAQHPPHVVLQCAGNPPNAIFQNNAWNRIFTNMTVFDDVFVDENLYSGLAVEADHRQKLHELILGSQGVVLNQKVQELVAQIETHNTALRIKAAAIPPATRGTFSVDDFCSLQQQKNINETIQATERNLAAAREQDPIRNTGYFNTITLPAFDIESIERILQQDISGIDMAALRRVQDHLRSIGQDEEPWIAHGMERLQTATSCPFCAQSLSHSPVITHYRAYFSNEYAALKQAVAESLSNISRTHNEDAMVGFERAVRIINDLRQFWSRFCDIPEITIDTTAIMQGWITARNAIEAILRQKQNALLEKIQLPADAKQALSSFEDKRQTIIALNQQLQLANNSIREVKERAATSNPATLAAELTRLNTIRTRHTPEIAQVCNDYLAEKTAKNNTEQQRDQAKTALEQYRINIFPNYQIDINRYLEKFNAGFRLDSVTPQNTRGGPTCTYNVVINNTAVSISGNIPNNGQPSFRSLLSAGDRNTLALSFFFASLYQNPNLRDMIIVIDDPISSLDDHRALTTVQEIRRLADTASQVIVLSHTKPFLCDIWEGTDPTIRVALQVCRDGVGSSIQVWDVNHDCITEHDKRHLMLREYLSNGLPNNREVAQAIRPLLEAFLRVAYPEHFPPSTMLGQFRHLCEQRIGTHQEILTTEDTTELRDLIEYANRFHHDTNPAWRTVTINDGELRGFVSRALMFAKR